MKMLMLSGAALAALVLSVRALGDDGETGPPVFEQIKGLAGEWVQVGEDGEPTDVVVSRSHVTAGGSALLEVLFPGTEHEMVTVYHPDGDDVVLTHYCVLGNQPRMKVKAAGENALTFHCMGGTNMASEDDNHMHEGRVTWVGEDHIQTKWSGYQNGEQIHTVEFDLVRKR